MNVLYVGVSRECWLYGAYGGEECKVEAVVVLLGLKGEGGGNPQECSLCQLLGSVAWWCQSMLAAVPFSVFGVCPTCSCAEEDR